MMFQANHLAQKVEAAMYGLISSDPTRESIGSPIGIAYSESNCPPASNGVTAGAPRIPVDSITPYFPGMGTSRSSGISFPTQFGVGNGPASIMAAFTAFVQQMFGQIAAWMQHPTLQPPVTSPSQPRYLMDGSQIGGAQPSRP